MRILSAAVILLLSAFAHFLPVWSRPDVFFAVTIDPIFRKTGAGRRILGRYRAILWSFTIAALGLFFATGLVEAVVVQTAGVFCALAVAHRMALVHAASPGAILEVDLAAPPETLPGGPLIALLPLASPAVLAVWVGSHWERLPPRIPVHWGLLGADRWVMRTTAGVYGFVGVHAAISLIFVGFAWGILHWSRRVSVSNVQAAADRRFRRLNVGMVLLMSYVPAIQAWIALLQPNAMGWWWSVALLLAMAIYCARFVRSGQALRRMPAGDRTPDACWKLGSFYVNPGDPSLFVAKRFGIGYTVNFGNGWSWIVLGALLATILTTAMLK